MYAAALTPAYLQQIGRAMIQYGEMLYLLRTDGGVLRLAPAQSWDVARRPGPDDMALPGNTRRRVEH